MLDFPHKVVLFVVFNRERKGNEKDVLGEVSGQFSDTLIYIKIKFNGLI